MILSFRIHNLAYTKLFGTVHTMSLLMCNFLYYCRNDRTIYNKKDMLLQRFISSKIKQNHLHKKTPYKHAYIKIKLMISTL